MIKASRALLTAALATGCVNPGSDDDSTGSSTSTTMATTSITTTSDALLTFGLVGASTVTVRRHVLANDGTPSLDFAENVVFQAPTINVLHGALHPKLPLLYLLAGSYLCPGCTKLAVSISYETLAFSPLIDVGDSFNINLHVNATGDVLHITGYSGGCTGYFDLPPDGAIPPLSAPKVLCGGAWSGRLATVSRSAGDIFYERRNSQSLHVGEWSNGLVDHGVTGSVIGDRSFLALAHDDTVLIEGGQNGVVATYIVSDDGLDLTLATTLDIDSTNFLQAGVVVPCD